jgi:hypothetical protein
LRLVDPAFDSPVCTHLVPLSTPHNDLDLLTPINNVKYRVATAWPRMHFEIRISNRHFAKDFVGGLCVSGRECQQR